MYSWHPSGYGLLVVLDDSDAGDTAWACDVLGPITILPWFGTSVRHRRRDTSSLCVRSVFKYNCRLLNLVPVFFTQSPLPLIRAAGRWFDSSRRLHSMLAPDQGVVLCSLLTHR
jgi:hypothetical protein